MKKFILPVILAATMIACNNSETIQVKPMPDSLKTTDSVVTENNNQGTGAGMAAGNSNAANVGIDTAAIGTNKETGKDTTHK